MAHTFEHTLDAWATNGTKSAPSSTLKSTGFTGGMKPPASVFNYQWDKIAKAISELQQYALTEDPSGGIWQTLAAVATSGSYNDLLNKPELKAIATSGSYSDLSNVPIASGSYVGQGTRVYSSPETFNTKGRKISLPFSASMLILCKYPTKVCVPIANKQAGVTIADFGGSVSDKASIANLSDDALYVNWNADETGSRYCWIAIK